MISDVVVKSYLCSVETDNVANDKIQSITTSNMLEIMNKYQWDLAVVVDKMNGEKNNF